MFLCSAFSLNQCASRRTAVFWRTMAFVCFASILLTFTRSAWIGMAAGLIVIGISMRKTRRIGFAVLLGSAVLCVVAATFVRSGGRLILLNPDGCTIHRIQVWEASWKAFVDKPIFGGGFGSFRERQRTFASDYFKSRGGTHTALCFYLHVAVEFGAIGLGLLCLGAIFYYRYFHQSLRVVTLNSVDQAILHGMHWFVIAMSVAWITDSQFFSPIKPELTFIILATIALSLNVTSHAHGSALPASLGPVLKEGLLCPETQHVHSL